MSLEQVQRLSKVDRVYVMQDEEVDPDIQSTYDLRERWLNSNGEERKSLLIQLWNALLYLRKIGKYILFLEFLKKKDSERGRRRRRRS